jgi:hypothetical protein
MTSNSPSFGPLFSASRLRRLRIVAGKLKPQQCETLHTPLSIFYLSCEEVGLASVAKCEKDVGRYFYLSCGRICRRSHGPIISHLSPLRVISGLPSSPSILIPMTLDQNRVSILLDLEGHGGKRIFGMSRVSTYVIF